MLRPDEKRLKNKRTKRSRCGDTGVSLALHSSFSSLGPSQQEEAREAYRSKIKEDVQALQKKRAEELRKAIQESEARMEHIKTEKEKELEVYSSG